MSSERHGKEHTDSFTQRSWTTDQRRIEPDVRAIDNEILQLLFVWAEGKVTQKKTKNERERVTAASESRELLRGKMPRSNFRLRVALSLLSRTVAKAWHQLHYMPSPHLESHKLSRTARPLKASMKAPAWLETVTHTPHIPYWGEATQVSTSNWENGRWSIGTESRMLGSTLLSGFPLTPPPLLLVLSSWPLLY